MTGNPLYLLAADHLAGVIALGILPPLWWLIRRRGTPRLAPVQWLLFWLLAGSSALHAGLAFASSGHGLALQALFMADAVALGIVADRVLRGESAGRFGAAVLAGSIVAYGGAALSGEPPDQIGLANKLSEILALAIVLRPALGARRRALRSLAGSAAIAFLVIATGASSWIGAFRASAEGAGAIAGHHVHSGHVPPPGAVMPAVPAREPTAAEQAAAAQLVLTARTALAKYNDVAVAAADGYEVNGISGVDFHAQNPKYQNDGRIFDPAHPETLVYGLAPNGRPVLLGAMFQMPKIDEPGPTPGGPLTVWHAHQHICISLTPPALAGLLSPLGMCPVGTFDMPLTSQMIHIWIVPGAPETIGDLDEGWRRAYLQASMTRP
jgi:hypothetical protein